MATEAPGRPQMPGHVLRKRIARKILLGYVVPLAVLLVAGLLVPILFWSYLSQADAEYDASVHAVDRANALRRAAQDAESDLRGFVRYRDETFRRQFQDAHDAFRDSYRDLYGFLDSHPNPGLKSSLEGAGSAYRYWRARRALPLLRDAYPLAPPPDAAAVPPRQAPLPAVPAARALAVRRSFEPVQLALDGLITEMEQEREALAARARSDDSLRLIVAVAVPSVAVLLAALIARLNTLGITRPLEDLTEAAETLEQGEMARLLVGADQEGPYPDDEIGDLQQAFRRMARTIGQREAILRAQNEALGALNRRVEAVLNATNDGIMMLDRGGGFSVANARFAELFGIEPDVLLDHTFSQAGPLLLSRFRNKEAAREKLHEIMDDPEAVADETYEIVEPHPRMLRMYSAPVRGGGDDEAELIGRIFVFRDVTRETAVDRMKTEFVSTVSHELRTPLTAIKGYVDLMASGQTGPLTDVQREFLSLVQTSTRRLTALINDMLDISRIESGRIAVRRESVDYLPLVRQTVRMMAGEAEKKRITLRVEVVGAQSGTDETSLPHVSGDGDRITQVLVNLLSNGIKYTPAGGAVTVSVEYEGDFVTTCVSDTGIGIGKEDQARLFQKFFRADNSTTREAGGTGLGLAITKAILEKLNGGIWAESEPGKGSRFYFTLPAANEAPPPSDAAGAERAPAVPDVPAEPAAVPFHPRKLILTVDSDLAVLHRVGHELRRGGEYATSNAATPGEALRRARALRPDLITLDPLAAGLDAFTLLAELQEGSSTRESPVAFVTLRAAGDAGEAELRDDVALLQKPAAGTDLGRLTARALGRSAAEAPAVLVVGDGALAERMHQVLAAPDAPSLAGARVLLAPTAAEAERFVHDPALSLIVLDTAAAPGTRAGRFAAAVCRTPESCRVPLIVLTDVPLDPDRVGPLVPFCDGPAPLSELAPRIEALLAARGPRVLPATRPI